MSKGNNELNFRDVLFIAVCIANLLLIAGWYLIDRKDLINTIDKIHSFLTKE